MNISAFCMDRRQREMLARKMGSVEKRGARWHPFVSYLKGNQNIQRLARETHVTRGGRKRSEFERRRWERDDQFRDNADLERAEMGTCRVRTACCCPRLRIQRRRCDASEKPKAAPKPRRRKDDGLFTYFSRQELASVVVGSAYRGGVE